MGNPSEKNVKHNHGQAAFISAVSDDKILETASYYPIFVSLQGKICLVVGGGSVGERKVMGLLKYGASVRITANDLTPFLTDQYNVGDIKWLGQVYEAAHLDHVNLVFAATSDKALNRLIAADADSRGIWCNMATEPGLGSFNIPAVFNQGPLSIAVSTSGLSPAFARKIRDKIAKEFGFEWLMALKLMGNLRAVVQAKALPTLENQRIFREIANLPLSDWIQSKEQSHIVQTIHEICKPWLSLEELRRVLREVW